MLKSLFGDLAERDKASPPREFAATAILETRTSQISPRGRIVDRHQKDLFVTGSAAQAMREHLATSRADTDPASRRITLIDPAHLWAGSVVKALSDATGHPVERLLLREHGTLRTLATIERTEVQRRGEPTLKLYHHDLRDDGSEQAEISLALIERSHLAAVIVGSLQPHAADALLERIHAACKQPGWQCPAIAFLLPPGAAWLEHKIAGIAWPPGLRVEASSEPLTGVSAVWNRLLALWDRMQKPAPVAAVPREAALLDPRMLEQQLRHVLRTDGVLGCCVVDTRSGALLSSEQRHAGGTDLGVAAAACALVMRTQLDAARLIGIDAPVDELMVTAGSHQQVMRNLTKRPGLFLLALLDRTRSNLALTRFKMMEAEKNLQ
jgi:predicted regulator of Ras-like GTPase activity (Roadblock/LC7/MglB family)